MKNPPTLADMCIATANDNRMAFGAQAAAAREGLIDRMKDNAEYRARLLSVASARKFVLDTAMSAYLCDMELSFKRGGHRARLRAIENLRQMARGPHAETWIEFDLAAFMERHKQRGSEIRRPPGALPDDPFPKKFGWLIRQHDKIESAFIVTEFSQSLIMTDRVTIHPVSVGWCADDEVLPWRTFKLWKDEVDEGYLVMTTGYRSTQVGWTYTFSEKLSSKMMFALLKAAKWSLKPGMPINLLWTLLATINDLPVTITHVAPSRGYISKGSYKKFLKHSVVHLTVPESRWIKVATKLAVMVRKRAHQVRGHWRTDWRHPPSPRCDHLWAATDGTLVCQRCEGRSLWITEHQRGDASLGFVTHDYEVHHDVV